MCGVERVFIRTFEHVYTGTKCPSEGEVFQLAYDWIDVVARLPGSAKQAYGPTSGGG